MPPKQRQIKMQQNGGLAAMQQLFQDPEFQAKMAKQRTEMDAENKTLEEQTRLQIGRSLTKKQKELLAEFDRLSSGDTHPEAAGFFAKVKDFFGTKAG